MNSWRLHGIGRKANPNGEYVETQKQIGVWVPIWSFGCQWGLGQSPAPAAAVTPTVEPTISTTKAAPNHDESVEILP